MKFLWKSTRPYQKKSTTSVSCIRHPVPGVHDRIIEVVHRTRDTDPDSGDLWRSSHLTSPILLSEGVVGRWSFGCIYLETRRVWLIFLALFFLEFFDPPRQTPDTRPPHQLRQQTPKNHTPAGARDGHVGSPFACGARSESHDPAARRLEIEGNHPKQENSGFNTSRVLAEVWEEQRHTEVCTER